MTAHWSNPGLGDAPVGQLLELPLLKRSALRQLRHWCDGEDGRTRIAEDFAQALPVARTAEAVNQLGHLVTLLTQRGRRPLMRHAVQCGCFGGDEALFAHLIAVAKAGDSEDAMAFALTLLTPEMAWDAVQTAAPPPGRVILTLSRQTQPTRH